MTLWPGHSNRLGALPRPLLSAYYFNKVHAAGRQAHLKTPGTFTSYQREEGQRALILGVASSPTAFHREQKTKASPVLPQEVPGSTCETRTPTSEGPRAGKALLSGSAHLGQGRDPAARRASWDQRSQAPTSVIFPSVLEKETVLCGPGFSGHALAPEESMAPPGKERAAEITQGASWRCPGTTQMNKDQTET